jgi:hypothetical protein
MNVCSQDCTPGAAGACPSGFDCVESDLSTPKCLRADGGGGGRCALATGRTGRAASGLVLALWAVAILAAGRRRRAK